MTHFWRVFYAEAYKQVRVYWGSRLNLLTEAVYPALHFAAAYYMFRPFLDGGAAPPWLAGAAGDGLGLFLLTGFFGYTIFQRLLWAALGMTNLERVSGTLEIQYLTPANRFALLIGAAAGGLVRVVYIYLAFLVGAVAFVGSWQMAHPAMALVALIALVVPGLAWGALLNGYILFSRDSSAYVSVLQPPLNFFSGVRFPVALLPGWMQPIAALVPLTWSLRVVRAILLEGAGLAGVAPTLLLSLGVSAICFLLAWWNVGRCERLAKERGTLVLY
ncbi:MAG: ABC transporter permease [Bacillota bacterium]